MTTGFGGSADTNTEAFSALQEALLQMQTSAILPVSGSVEAASSFPHQSNYSRAEALTKLAMPESWVRGAIIVRCNSLLRGHSAVRLEVIQDLIKLLRHDLVPLVPLRGSISASGDLCPLSYIAGTLEGNPDIYVWSGPAESRVLVSADKALASIGIAPIEFGPKETLGLLNGTAFSVAAASLCQHETDTLTTLAQILTAMSVEALLGTIESFDHFIAAVRPHAGQNEAAANIGAFLKGSKLTRSGNRHDGELRQDRYALRTSSQWLGPVLEDLSLARNQLITELNSTTDNPLIDATNRRIYHGGNFQASSVASSTEKTRMALQKIGKMIFAQSTELLDAKLAHNLPPNLVADEPSLSYTMKGVDINMAAYYSELSFLANPVTNHVQTAEMSNQSLNSLALISARFTHDAVDLVSLMSSAYLYALCQALDLRAMNARFMSRLLPEIIEQSTVMLDAFLPGHQINAFHNSIWATLKASLAATTGKDSSDRFKTVAISVSHLLVEPLRKMRETEPDALRQSGTEGADLSIIKSWTQMIETTSKSIFVDNREKYLANPDATEFLGVASKKMYKFVRNDLGVPMNRGLADYPMYGGGKKREKFITGTQISRIYKALREERATSVIMECLAEAVESNRGEVRKGHAKL